MKTVRFPFVPVRTSLAELVGPDYLSAVCEARAALLGQPPTRFQALARRPVDWYPKAFHRRLLELLPQVGKAVCGGIGNTPKGATSQAFSSVSSAAAAPLSALGYLRVGEDGRLRLATKSEHYHTPLGHAFPGYRLIDTARSLGIPNATHNNTRGAITRLLEERLVAAAHGLANDDHEGLRAVLADTTLQGLNRVLNLETGSLAVEAGIKHMLARFHRVLPQDGPPPQAGCIPVLLVMGNKDGGTSANYHGTTLATQFLRGLWPEGAAQVADANFFRIHAIRPNVIADLDDAFARYGQGPCRIAGFIHEIVMMNYGALKLEPAFLQHAYALCDKHGVPTLCDEIQSCLWAPGLFLFREYGLHPSMVAVGKGFPGGEFPASRLLFSAALDRLPQFGALVTNGQEELAALAYLITMHWAQQNTNVTRDLGDYYEAEVRSLAAQYAGRIASVTGYRHMVGLEFHDLAAARHFTAALTAAGLDISAQTYKADCPPVALTKLPLTACRETIDAVIQRMRTVCQASPT